MNFADNWKALSARIRGLVDAGTLHSNFLLAKSSDPYGRAKYLRTQSERIIEALQEFEKNHSTSLPASARTALSEFMKGPATQVGPAGGGPDSMQERCWATLVKLAAFEAELSYCLADSQAYIRARSERAFVHLQRLIAVDADIRTRWEAALPAGEVRCEQLGAVHLLQHGIWAFKAYAHGARTDLVFQEPFDSSAIPPGAAEGLVLTEWKVARTDSEGPRKFEEGRAQAQRYAGSAFEGSELAAYRYAVVVSTNPLVPPSDVIVDGVSYRHVNIAVAPRVPSRSVGERA